VPSSRPRPKFVGVKTGTTLNLHAARNGVRSVEVALVQGADAFVVAQQAYAEPFANDSACR
jgi:hypothetical protein